MALPITPAIGPVTNVKSSVISSEHLPFHILADNTGNVINVSTEGTLQTVLARTNALISFISQDFTAQTHLARTNALIAFVAQDSTAQTHLARTNAQIAIGTQEVTAQSILTTTQTHLARTNAQIAIGTQEVTAQSILTATQTTLARTNALISFVAQDSTAQTHLARTNAQIAIGTQEVTAQTILARTNALISFVAQDSTAQTSLSRMNALIQNVATDTSIANVVARIYSLENTVVSGIVATGTAGNPGSEYISMQGGPLMHPIKVGGYTFAVSNSFTRPSDTTQYSVGDLVASSTTNTSVVFPSFNVARTVGESGVITKVRLNKNDNDLVNASFRIHFYTTSPTPNRGDNLGWQTNWANAYLDSVDITFDKSFLDGATASKTTEIPFQLAPETRTIWAAVEARGAYTPISAGVFTITIFGYQD